MSCFLNPSNNIW